MAGQMSPGRIRTLSPENSLKFALNKEELCFSSTFSLAILAVLSSITQIKASLAKFSTQKCTSLAKLYK